MFIDLKHRKCLLIILVVFKMLLWLPIRWLILTHCYWWMWLNEMPPDWARIMLAGAVERRRAVRRGTASVPRTAGGRWVFMKDVTGLLVRVVGRPRVRSGESKLETAVSQTFVWGKVTKTCSRCFIRWGLFGVTFLGQPIFLWKFVQSSYFCTWVSGDPKFICRHLPQARDVALSLTTPVQVPVLSSRRVRRRPPWLALNTGVKLDFRGAAGCVKWGIILC